MTPLNIIYNLISRPSLPPPLSLSLRFAIADAALRVSDITPDVLPPARAGAGAWHGPSCQRLELHYRTNRSRRKRRADELPDLDKTGDEEDWNRQRAPALLLARSLARSCDSFFFFGQSRIDLPVAIRNLLPSPLCFPDTIAGLFCNGTEKLSPFRPSLVSRLLSHSLLFTNSRLHKSPLHLSPECICASERRLSTGSLEFWGK